MLKTKLLGATAAAEPVFIEDVFSTWLYTGNSSTQTITNGIDLAGEGGLVWIKQRNAAASPYTTIEFNCWHDSARGSTQYRLRSDSSQAEQLYSSGYISSFNSNGFTLDNGLVNHTSADSYTSWTFRKAPRFFDVVTYTGTGSARTVSHNLGVVPGCIIVKRTDTTGDWQVYHRSNTAAPETDYLVLNSTAATADDNTRWNDTLPTNTVFSLGTATTVNASGGTYVAYLFAHDPLGPSGDGSDGLIACGSFVGTGSEQEINLGWEPQFIIRKAASTTSGWTMFDNMRGFSQTNTAYLYPNTSGAESNYTGSDNDKPTATGFKTTAGSGVTFIYIAIRRGPMRVPTSGTEVFAPSVQPESGGAIVSTSFPVDMFFDSSRASNAYNMSWFDRLRGNNAGLLRSTGTGAESSLGTTPFGIVQNGVKPGMFSTNPVQWLFRRAPGFFDVVAYTGDGASSKTIQHNLGVPPELIIGKGRSFVSDWPVYYGSGLYNVFLNLTQGETGNGTYFETGAEYTSISSSTQFDVSLLTGGNATKSMNTVNQNYILYLFATLPGISKVGSYTGNGSNQTINCGFTGGARFVLIKRTDSTGDWYVWDTARGIVSGNDPHLSLNTTAAEVTSDDTIDPDSSGFIVNQVAATNVNVSSASYIFLAVS